jgi:hypothetical protein
MTGNAMRVITASRRTTALMCLASIAFAATGAWLANEHSDPKAMVAGWAILGSCSLVGVLCTLQLAWPSRIVLDGDGLAFHYLFGTFRRRWGDIRQIDILEIRSMRLVKLVANPGNSDLELGGAWPVSADELSSIIKDYLVRFGRTSTA